MSQLLERKTKTAELQPKLSFDLSKVAIDHTASSLPKFLFKEILDEDGDEKRLIGVAMTDGAPGADGEKSASAFSINKKGELHWTAGDLIDLVIVRDNDGSATELGSDGSENGVIQDLDALDEVYAVSKEFATIIKSVGSFNKDGFDTLMTSPEIKADVVRVKFNEALSGESLTDQNDEPVDDRKAATKSSADRRLNKSRIRLQDRFAALENKAVDTPVDVIKAIADDEELQAQIAAAQGYAVTDKRHTKLTGKDTKTTTVDTASLGISDAIRDEMELIEKQRLAERVEKYTQKVASYEELATEALGRRMKGRLFNPLTRKGKNEARKDDQYMHLLEGFSRVLDAALMQQWLAEGHSDDEVAMKIYEHQQTRQEARAARNHEELRKDKLGSFLDKYANMSKGKKIGVTIGAAAVIGALGAGLGVVGGVAAIGGGVVLAGAKVSKTYYQHRSKMYETGNKEPMRSPDKLVSVENGKADTRTAIEQVFAGRQYAEKNREKAIQKSDRNKKVAAGLAAVSAIGIGAIGAGAIMEHAESIQEIWNKPLMPDMSVDVGDADGSWVTEVPAPQPAPAPFEFSTDALTVTDGNLGSTEFTPAGLDNFHQWVDDRIVQPGDSIWNLSEDYLHSQGVANPSVYQIDAVKDTVLADFKARGLADANGWLSAGQHLNVK